MNRKLVLFAVSIVYLLWHFIYLEKFLKVDIDDAYLCEPAWTLLTTGKVAVPTWKGLYGSEEHEARYGRLFLFAQLPFLAAWGPRPMAVRLPALLSGFLLLWLTYLFGRYVYDKRAALLATILLSLSGIFFLTTHHGRPDTMLALFVLGAFFLFLKAQDQKNNSLFFWSGLLSTLSWDVHLNGIMIFLSLGLLFFIELRSTVFYSRNFWSWSAGAICGILWWIALHILPNPTIFWENWRRQTGKGAFIPPILASLNPLHWLETEWNRYLVGYWTGPAKRNLIEAFVIFVSLGYLIRKPDKSSVEKKMLLYNASFLVLFAVIVPQKTFWYLIYLYPFFMLWMANIILRAEAFPSIFRILSLSALLLLYFVNIAVWSLKYWKADYKQFIKEIKQTIPSESAVMGDLVFWFGFAKEAKNFASLTEAESFERILGVDFSGVLKIWETDYVIVQTDEYNQAGYSRIRPFLEKHAEPAGKVETEFYGAGAVTGLKQKQFTIFKVKK